VEPFPVNGLDPPVHLALQPHNQADLKKFESSLDISKPTLSFNINSYILELKQ